MNTTVYLADLKKDLRAMFNNLNIDVGDVDCIIMEALNLEYTDLYKDRVLSAEDVERVMQCVEERKQGKPVTKIFHKVYFYGLEFYVDENVLSPRQETELLVDYAIAFLKTHEHAKVLDLCTGSGAIACAMKKNTNAYVVATDISDSALNVARQNAKQLGLEIEFKHSDMFKNLAGEFDLIVSNPPYIETDVCKTLASEVRDYDPMIALDGGADGLVFYKEIRKNMRYIKDGGQLVLEIGYNQGKAVRDIFKGYKVRIIKDYSNNDRIVIVEK